MLSSSTKMKRIAWLLLAVVCASMAQVQPSDVFAKAKVCHCCRIPGACGMPGCCPRPEATARLDPNRAAQQATCPSRKREGVRSPAERFYSSFLNPAAYRFVLPAPAAALPAARLPLFKAHCSFLI
jgi:hypothetical protein